jgi:hypothetical protein
MPLSLRSPWRSPRALLAGWALYWIALLAVGGRLVARMVHFASTAPKGTASVKATFDNGAIHLVALSDGRPVMGGAMGILTLALLVAVPPLLMWVLWLAWPARRAPTLAPATEAPFQLPAAPPDEAGYLDAPSREAMRIDAARRDRSRDRQYPP